MTRGSCYDWFIEGKGPSEKGIKMNNFYRSQAEAVKDARIGIWGDVPLAKREMIYPDPTVTAQVNGRLIVIDFDNYGRLSGYKVRNLDELQKLHSDYSNKN